MLLIYYFIWYTLLSHRIYGCQPFNLKINLTPKWQYFGTKNFLHIYNEISYLIQIDYILLTFRIYILYFYNGQNILATKRVDRKNPRIYNQYCSRMESIFVAILQIIKIDCSIKSFHYIYIPLYNHSKITKTFKDASIVNIRVL